MNLGLVLRRFRIMSEIDLRSMATIIGTSAATLSRFERGENCDSRTFATILRWLMDSDMKAIPKAEAK